MGRGICKTIVLFWMGMMAYEDISRNLPTQLDGMLQLIVKETFETVSYGDLPEFRLNGTVQTLE